MVPFAIAGAKSKLKIELRARSASMLSMEVN